MDKPLRDLKQVAMLPLIFLLPIPLILFHGICLPTYTQTYASPLSQLTRRVSTIAYRLRFDVSRDSGDFPGKS